MGEEHDTNSSDEASLRPLYKESSEEVCHLMTARSSRANGRFGEKGLIGPRLEHVSFQIRGARKRLYDYSPVRSQFVLHPS